MKLKANIDYTAFLLKVRECGGEVCYWTKSGDQLNLRSLLSEYVFVTASLGSDLIKDGDVVCENEADYNILAAYLEGEH